MAVINGFLSIGADTPGFNGNITDQFNEYARYAFPGFVSLASTSPGVGALTQVNNNPTAKVINGIKATSFFDDYYNDIHIIPSNIDLGIVSSGQNRTVRVFNAYLNSQTLNALTKTTLDGINITGPAPRVYNPLEEVEYSITALTEGPVNIDGTFNFNWDTIQDMVLPVIGSRAVLFPFIMTPPTAERLNWITQVISSENGNEQRIRVRNAPRQSFEVNFSTNINDSNFLDNLLYGWRDNVYILPISSECQRSTAATAIDSQEVFVETRFSDFRAGGVAIIYNNARDFDLFQVSSILDDRLIANRNISAVFPAGSLVMPARSCRLVNSPTRNLNGYNSTFSGVFESIDNIVLTSVASAFTYTYNSVVEDVYTDEQLTVESRSPEVYQANVQVIDNGSSQIEIFNTWTNNKPDRAFRVQLNSLEEVWNFRRWLHRRSGRLVPFWLPTFESNFRITQATGNIDSVFTVVDDGQRTLIGNRKTIAFKFISGTIWEFREITTITQSGNNLNINISTSLGRNAEDLEFICYMDRKRLSTDNIEILWTGNFTATAVIPAINTE